MRFFVVSDFPHEHPKEASLSVSDTAVSFFMSGSFSPLRLGQGLVNRCDQLSQILGGCFVYDTEQIRPLFIFIA